MFRLVKNNGLCYYLIEAFEETKLVRHCFTTRIGGVSEGEYKSLNLRMNCDDKRENILENYKLICDEIGVERDKLVFSNQIHEDKIYNVTSEDYGNGITKPNSFKSADGLMCAEPKVPIITFFADCVPLFFLDKKQRAIALSHSGWKGTVKNIAAKTVEAMGKQYGSKPSDILAAIGPSIGECHFEVGSDVGEQFSRLEGGIVKMYGDKAHVNLWATIQNQLISTGIPQANITCANICTYCNSDLLFSHRKTSGRRGSLAAIMELK